MNASGGLKQRRRGQQGGVLSGVLILVAFLGIISGALMTELSTNFLLSRALMNRAAHEATVSSAVELALDSLQTSPPVGGCPSLSPVTLNGSTAVVSYLGCAPVVDRLSPPYQQVASGSAFIQDAAHDNLAAIGQDLYLVGDSSGKVFQFDFGDSSPNWTNQLPGGLTGPPRSMLDTTVAPGDVTSLVPIAISQQNQQGDNQGQCPSNYCVARLAQDVGKSPESTCFMAADSAVTSAPAAAISFPNTAYFGSQSGTMYAYSTSESSNCSVGDSVNGTPGFAVVGGPIVVAGPPKGSSVTDEIVVLVSNGSSSQLLRYTATAKKDQAPNLALADSVSLPYRLAKGLATSGGSLPMGIAVTFVGGQVMLVQVQPNTFAMSVVATRTVPAAIDGAPYWCRCPSPGDQIGVAGTNGALYLFDSALKLVATYPAGGASITTSPSSDGVGDWFFGADDGYVYEVQRPAGLATMIRTARFGPFGNRVGSAAQVGGCRGWICVYVGTQSGKSFLVPLDARDLVLSACVSTAPPACSGVNPRLWVKAQVGTSVSQRTVDVQGWSYYSP